MSNPTEKPEHAAVDERADQASALCRPEFQSHRLNELGVRKVRELDRRFSELLDYCESILPMSPRERALVATKLQEASMFCKRGIAIDKANQDPG